MNCVRGDTVPMHHLFTLDEGAVVEAAYMRVLHEDGDDVYEDVPWTSMTPLDNGFVAPFDTTLVDHDGEYVVVYRADLVGGGQVTELAAVQVGPPAPSIPTGTQTVRLWGHVLDGGHGRPLGDVAVEAAPLEGGTPMARAVANYAGVWTLDVPPGDYVFTFTAEGHGARTVRAQVGDQEREVQFSNVALEPDDERLRGSGVHRVTDVFTDKHDLPLQGIAVTVRSPAAPDVVVAQCTTDADGRWRVHLDPGEHLMHLALPSGDTKVLRLRVGLDGGHELVELRTSTVVNAASGEPEQLSNGSGEVTMRDVVTDSHGRGIQGVVVKAYLYSEEVLDFTYVAGDVTTSTGEFGLNLDHGRYRMTFDGVGFKHLERIVNV